MLYKLTNPNVVVIDFRLGDFRMLFNNTVRWADDSAHLRAYDSAYFFVAVSACAFSIFAASSSVTSMYTSAFSTETV